MRYAALGAVVATMMLLQPVLLAAAERFNSVHLVIVAVTLSIAAMLGALLLGDRAEAYRVRNEICREELARLYARLANCEATMFNRRMKNGSK